VNFCASFDPYEAKIIVTEDPSKIGRCNGKVFPFLWERQRSLCSCRV